METKFRPSEWELTQAGEDQLSKDINTSLRSPIREDGSRQGVSSSAYSRQETLDSIKNKLYYAEEESSYRRALPVLIKKNLVIRVSSKPESSAILLDKIESPIIKKDLSIYRDIARDADSVSDWDIDYLFKKVKNKVTYSDLEEHDFPGQSRKKETVDNVKSWEIFSSLVKSARTRGDKIVAIDSAMSQVHGFGPKGYAYFGWKGRPEDYKLATKVLSRLFDE